MRARAGLLLIAVLAAPGALGAQRMFYMPRGGEMSVEANGEAWRSDQTTDASFLGTRAWLRVPVSGMLFPRPFALTYALTIRPQVNQQRASIPSGSFTDRKTGFDANVSLFQSLPVSVAFYASRSTGEQRGSLGNTANFALSDRGGILRLQNAWFPMSLQHSQRDNTNNWQGDIRSPVYPRDERLRSTAFSAQSSKTQLAYETVDFSDHVGFTSFRANAGSLQHELRWGTGSRLATSYEHNLRLGSDAHRRTRFSERLQVRHGPYAISELTYSRFGNRVRGVSLDGRSFNFAERVTPASWISASFDASRQTSHYIGGRRQTATFAPRLTLTRQLRGVRFIGNLSGSTERTRRIVGTGVWFDAVAEPHTINETRSFLLTHPRGDVASLTLSSVDQTVVYASGTDYRVVPDGDRVRVYLTLTGRITVGDVVLATYRYRGEYGDDYRLLGGGADVAASARFFTVRHLEQVRSATTFGPDAIGGGPAGGYDRVTSLNARHGTPVGQIEAQLERRARTASATDFVASEARLNLVPAPRASLQTAFSAGVTRSVAGGRVIDVATGTASAGAQPWAALRLQANVDQWLMRINHAPPERLVGGSLEADWNWGQVTTLVRAAAQERSAGESSGQSRFSVRVVRRF